MVAAALAAIAGPLFPASAQPAFPPKPPAPPQAPLNGAGAHAGGQSSAAQPSADRLSGHGGPVKAVAAYHDPSGATLALTASFDNAVGFWNVSSGERILWLEGHDAGVNAVTFTPNGAAALSASDDFTLRYWSIQSGLSTALEGHKGKAAQLAVSPDGRFAASASWDG